MKYLFLKFKNAGLILADNVKGNKHYIKDSLGKFDKGVTGSGYDTNTPVPWHVLSGVLAHLCGEIPVPTKRQTFFKRIEVLDNIAKNSYISYDMKPMFNEKGYIENSELFKRSKTAHDSHAKVTTELIDHNGVKQVFSGHYTHNYLRRAFAKKEDYDKFINFLSELIGEDCLKLTFEEVYSKLTRIRDTEDGKKKIKCFFEKEDAKEIDEELKMPWKWVLFGKALIDKATGANTCYNWKTPLLERNGIGRITYASGKIICPIEDERIIDALHRNSGVATLLEGGMVYIIGLENYPPIPNFENVYEKIFQENDNEVTEN